MSLYRSLLAVTVMILLASSDATSQNATKHGSRVRDPFAVKMRVQNPKNVSAQQAFRENLRSLSARLHGLVRQTPTTQGSDLLRSADIMRLHDINGGPVHVVYDEAYDVPVYIRGRSLLRHLNEQPHRATGEDLHNRAVRFLTESRRLLRLEDPQAELVRTELVVDELGMTHIRFQQYYNGVEVWGRDARVHLTKDGKVESYNGRTIPTPARLANAGRVIPEEDAVRYAHESVRLPGRPAGARQIIDPSENGAACLCWLVNIRGGLDENWMVFVDASTGEIRRSYNHVFYDGPIAGSGTDLAGQTRALNVYQLGSTFYLIDASKPMFQAAQSTIPQDGKGVIYTLDARNADSSLFFVTSNTASSWSNPSAVSAAANGAKVYDYYNTVLGRNAIDGNGATMNLVVKFKVGFNNAFWNGQLMVFGTGDGTAFSDLAGAMDVTAHEMTHGVVERTANLIYENQPGALNESFSDVFGAMAEVWADPTRSDWWMIGEAITTPSIAGDALRRLDQPDATNIAFNGQQPGHMDQYQNLPNTQQGDHGGVHVNSGIPNRAFYLFATSSGVSLDDAAKVYYRALTLYLTRNSQFVDCRLAVIKAAEDLFGGPGNAKATAAAAAFDAVGIGSGTATPPPPTQPPVVGNDYLAVIDASSGALFRSTTDAATIIPVTAGALWSRPTATDDGSLIFYVDGTTNLHAVNTDGTNDQTLTTSGGFNNISISPDGRYLAATTTFGEAALYIFDLQSGGGAQAIPLYTPTYSEGVTAGTILYPDRIDWASDGQILMYDALNRTINASGDTTLYWDINLLRVSDGVISRLFPPQPPGVNIGNAVFASNTDNIISFDYFQTGDSVRILAVDLNTGGIGQVTNNWFSLGSPTFSSDDGRVYYHYIDQSGAATFVVDLAQDGITGVGNDQALLNGAIFPVSFTVGAQTTGVPSEDTSLPVRFGLHSNYPNPFNPETRLRFDLTGTGYVSLKVFDLMGREVGTLLEGHMPAGVHETILDGSQLPSGTYIVRLAMGDQVSSMKITLLR